MSTTSASHLAFNNDRSPSALMWQEAPDRTRVSLTQPSPNHSALMAGDGPNGEPHRGQDPQYLSYSAFSMNNEKVKRVLQFVIGAGRDLELEVGDQRAELRMEEARVDDLQREFLTFHRNTHVWAHFINSTLEATQQTFSHRLKQLETQLLHLSGPVATHLLDASVPSAPLHERLSSAEVDIKSLDSFHHQQLVKVRSELQTGIDTAARNVLSQIDTRLNESLDRLKETDKRIDRLYEGVSAEIRSQTMRSTSQVFEDLHLQLGSLREQIHNQRPHQSMLGQRDSGLTSGFESLVEELLLSRSPSAQQPPININLNSNNTQPLNPPYPMGCAPATVSPLVTGHTPDGHPEFSNSSLPSCTARPYAQTGPTCASSSLNGNGCTSSDLPARCDRLNLTTHSKPPADNWIQVQGGGKRRREKLPSDAKPEVKHDTGTHNCESARPLTKKQSHPTQPTERPPRECVGHGS